MKILLKILLTIIVLLFLVIFFFVKIIPSNILPPTNEQTAFCQTHSCGLIGLDTPFGFVKNYIKR